eukprot:TRINITY_DN299_c0_g1_i2.p1 TRINITY_DN299_c0_g1~~TRINITY_DN299_c0_g1_i2.p1  ORF type:complete len:151 (+),score=12.30 TRINITY_DN299_c0_g1_i2:668-1120(+)
MLRLSLCGGNEGNLFNLMEMPESPDQAPAAAQFPAAHRPVLLQAAAERQRRCRPRIHVGQGGICADPLALPQGHERGGRPTSLRPVASLHDFLNALPFSDFFLHTHAVYQASQRPLFTPEPNICHQLLGHGNLFADPGFADQPAESCACR